MPDDILARAEQAMEGVTDGPWEFPVTVLGLPSAAIFAKDDGGTVEVMIGLARPTDGHFIAAAPQLVRDLISEVKRLRGGEA